MKKFAGLLIIFLAFVLIFIGTIPAAPVVSAAPNAQFVTSTAGPDGRILYTVVEGDNCSIVAFNHGITVPQLRQLNSRLDENCTLTVGQQIVVGLVASNAPTAGPAP
ncbi:MAG TPA: LysM domain-containing protein, partial [Anaerolineales bacterium]|nr:LysM domain-containing protein [Anaerolineales bacterium]